MKRPRDWYYRTVKNGKVKILGNYYKPKREYENQLEGERLAFGLYWTPTQEGWKLESHIYLWGTEEYSRNIDDNEAAERNYKLIFPDGIHSWAFWEKIE